MTILHLDAQLLVVDKPAGLLSVPGRARDPCVEELLRDNGVLAAGDELRTVHRLDRDASGVLAFARALDAQRALTAQFESHTVEKIYLALVRGCPGSEGRVDAPIAADRGASRARIHPDGKPSVTQYRVLESFAGFALLECRPLTGRLHQIRLHLSSIGCPLAVDPLYGGATALHLSAIKPGYRPSRRHEERPLIDRLTLHARRLVLDHPATGQRSAFESPLPKDLRATLNQLRKIQGGGVL